MEPTTRHSAFRTSLDSAIIAVPSDAAVHEALQLVRGGGQVLLFAHTKRARCRSGRADSAGRPGLAVHPESVRAGRVPAAPNFHLPTPISQIDLASICLDEKDLIGSYSSDFTLQAEVARLVFSRQLDVRPLITHRFPLEQTAAAVALASHPTDESLKILVRVSND